MKRHFAGWGALIGFLIASACLAADESKPVEGTFLVGDRSYKLAYVVAYETKGDDETLITILASDRKIPVDTIKKALKEDEGSDERLFLTQPHLMVTFKKSGEGVRCKAWADNASYSRGGSGITGEFHQENGRVRGDSKLDSDPDVKFKSGFDFKWDVALGLDAPQATAKKPAGPVKASVSGTFKGNGKAAKLMYVSALPGEPFNDKPSIVLIFTEKDHSKEKQPKIRAGFGNFGSALILSVHEDGSIFGCEVAHAAHSKGPFSSIGSIRTTSFDMGEGYVEGELKTEGSVETFGQTWEVDLKFTVPYRSAATKPATSEPTTKKRDARGTSESSTSKKRSGKEKPEAKPESSKDGETVNVHDLPLPKDAEKVEYKELVEQMVFKSGTGVEPLARDFAKKLAAQGWKSSGADLINAKSSILNLTRGEATLTIFVKPAASGSQVTIMASGLDWSEKEK